MDDFGIGAPGLLQCSLHAWPPLDKLQLYALAGRPLLFDLVAPAFEMIGPGFDRVAPQANRIEPEANNPAIIIVKDKGRLTPISVLVLVPYDGPQLVVPVAKEIGPDLQKLTDDPLDRIAAAIELGVDFLNMDPCVRPP